MSPVAITLLVIVIVLAIIIAVLYFLGKKAQKKQAEQQELLDANKQTVSMLIIDKKRMKMKDAGLPQMVLDHTNDGNIQFTLQFIQCIGACRIACHHNGLHLKSFQETHNLFGEAGDRFLGLATIGHSRRISEIYDLLIGNLPHDLPGYGQSADAGIKYTDRGIFFQRSYILLIHGISPSIFLTSQAVCS